MAKSSKSSKSVFSRVNRGPASMAQSAMDNPFVQLLGFAVFLLTVVFLVAYDFNARAGALDDIEVGQSLNVDVVASRDFAFVQTDEAASAKMRDEAASEVPVVYDWQEGLGDTLRQRVEMAFSSMRGAMEAAIRESLSRDEPQRLAALEASVNGVNLTNALISLITPEQRVVLGRELRKEVFDPALGVNIRDSDFDAFARAGFSPSIESDLADIVGQVMTNIIVASQRVLDAEKERGIFLRRLRAEKVLIEYHIKDVNGRFITLERAPALVEDLGARRLTSIGDRELREAILSTASSLIQPNTFQNTEKTLEKRQAARRAVEDQVVREEIRKGQLILAAGESVSERHVRLIDTMLQDEGLLTRSQLWAGVVIFFVVFLTTLYIFGRRNIRKFRPQRKDVIFMALSMVLMLLMTRLGDLLSHALVEQFGTIPLEAWYFAIPVAAGGMLVRLILNSEHAVVFTIVLAALVGVMADNSLFYMSFAAIGGLVGAGSVRAVKNRMTLMWSGLFVGGVNAIAISAFLLIQGEFLQVSTLIFLVMGLSGGIVAGLLVSAVLPLFEAIFGYTTDIKLLELANLNHPALRELIMRAPGSYHHSMMVGSLCEAAAESIGCNPLLARVGAYYHDIGKAKNPQYFAENQKLGHNPHDKLKPNMSALIIKAHVKDGLEMARQYRLPVVIQDFIAQHHGTSLIAYFYHKAKQLEDPDIPEVDEKDYRYPGPKPQTRETAICLLADGIEAASRAMPDPTPARLKGLVQKMINKAFTDGQLDECELTLKDLNAIALAFNRILAGIHHHRPEYPGEKKKESSDRSDGSAQKDRKASGESRKRRAQRSTPTKGVDAAVAKTNGAGKNGATNEDDNHAGGDHGGGASDDAPPTRAPREDDRGEGRESLPRLGSN